MTPQWTTSIKASVLLACGALLGWSAQILVPQSAVAQQNEWQTVQDYQRLVDTAWIAANDERTRITKALLVRTWVAHANRDPQAAVDELAEDYSWYRVSDDGPRNVVSGKSKVLAATKALYDGDALDNYLGFRAIPLAVVGNLAVQLEAEAYETADGRKDVQMLTIYELKDGKHRRLWSFVPETFADVP